jgi:hypothetical protein
MNERNDIRLDNSSSSPSEKSGPLGEHQPIEADREPDPAARKHAKVRVEYKHSLATRWMHWINFPLLFVMIYSGILIYWADSQHEGLNAHHVYRLGIGDWTLFRFFPRWFYNGFHLKYQLAQAASVAIMMLASSRKYSTSAARLSAVGEPVIRSVPACCFIQFW